ncbi:hypothetical protein TanjilG_26404 [Lupinus angustifolius]|uniref:Uncharacterized protein n=1 Tax=Lupinus angustifolius TaxID=3871 RepID=A0A4P1R321_LUPAN|nr:hypothetical protein TanjilG_26404 [Lupinus angustifolius]
MGSEAPSWAEQWGAGGIGSMEDNDNRSQKDITENKNSGSKSGLTKAKATVTNCVKWIKSLFKRLLLDEDTV